MKRLNDKIVYLSGPMSGIPNYNWDFFAEVHSKVVPHCKVVLNPTRHPLGLTNLHYYCLGAIDARASDAIILLPNWQRSRGVYIELLSKQYPLKPIQEVVSTGMELSITVIEMTWRQRDLPKGVIQLGDLK